MSLLSLLVALIILCAVFWAATAIMGAFGIGDPIRTVVLVILVLFALFYVVSLLTGGGPALGSLRLR